MKVSICIIVLVISACGVLPSPGSDLGAHAGGSGCVPQGFTTANVEVVGLPGGPLNGAEQKALAGWISASSGSCDMRWLKVMVGPFAISAAYNGQLPSAISAVQPLNSGNCPPLNASALTVAGWKTLSGTIQIAAAQGETSAASHIAFSTTDLLLEHMSTQEKKLISFKIDAQVRQFCASLVSGSPSDVATWATFEVDGQIPGGFSCGKATGTWTGTLNPTSPPVACEASSGSGGAVAVPSGAKDSM